MSYRTLLGALLLACASSLSAQDPNDPGGLFERELAELVLTPPETTVLGVGRLGDLHSAGDMGSILSFDDEEGLYSPFAVEAALRRLLGFDALEVSVNQETGVLRARTSVGGRARLAKQLDWLRAVERQRASVRLRAYQLDAWPSWELRPGVALGAKALEALRGQRPWAEFASRLPDGVRVAGVALRREFEFLGDYQINQTGITPTLNPERVTFREGLWGALTCSRMPADSRAVLEFELGVAIHEGAKRRSFLPDLPLVLPRWSRLEARGSCVVASNQTLVLAVAHEAGRIGSGKVLLITAEVGAVPAVLPPADAAVVLRRYAWGALDRPRRRNVVKGRRWSVEELRSMTFGDDVGGRRERISDSVRLAVDPDRWSDESFVAPGLPNGLVVCQAGGTQKRVAAYLQRTYADAVKTVSHQVVVRRGSAAPHARLSVAACEGRAASVAWHSAQSLFGEVERSAGAVSVRFKDPGDDPIVSEHVHGFALRLRGLAASGALRVSLDLRREALGEGLVTTPSLWGPLEHPQPGWSWRVHDSVSLGGKQRVVGVVRPPKGALTQVILDSRLEETQ